jgi:hypothetical protein
VTERGSIAQLLQVMAVKEHNPKQIAANYNGWHDSWTTILEAYMLSATMVFFGMSNLSDTPTKNLPAGQSLFTGENTRHIYVML